VTLLLVLIALLLIALGGIFEALRFLLVVALVLLVIDLFYRGGRF
jgi:hypothetical protein